MKRFVIDNLSRHREKDKASLSKFGRRTKDINIW